MQEIPVNTIDSRISRELRPGEQLLWSGKPDPEYMSQRRAVRVFSFRFWVMLCLLFVVLLLDLVYVLISLSSNTGLGLVILFSLLLLFFLVQAVNLRVMREQMRAQLKDLQHTMYAITNQRLVVVVGKESLRVFSSSRTDIGRIDRVETRDGWGDISYGLPVSVASPLIVALTTNKMVGIPDVRAVQELLLKTFKD